MDRNSQASQMPQFTLLCLYLHLDSLAPPSTPLSFNFIRKVVIQHTITVLCATYLSPQLFFFTYNVLSLCSFMCYTM